MLKRARLGSCVLALLLFLSPLARAEAPPPRRWVPTLVLYTVSAVGAAVAGYGISQIETAPNARTLGAYHLMANNGSTELGAGGVAFVLCGIAGSVALAMGLGVPPRRHAQLVPHIGGMGLAVSF